LLGWLADHLAIANLAQVGFIAQLIADYLPDMARHVWIGRLCLRAVCDKIQDIRGVALESLAKVESMLVHIVTALVEADQEVLLSPNVWRHADLLESMLKPDIVGEAAWVELAARNSALLFKATSTESSSSPRRHQMEEIHVS
jgi:mediator of RNA polymerase II transcription subunit 12